MILVCINAHVCVHPLNTFDSELLTEESKLGQQFFKLCSVGNILEVNSFV